MSAQKKQATRQNDRSSNSAPSPVPACDDRKPSTWQKCLLALAIVAETSWVAALLAMALAE